MTYESLLNNHIHLRTRASSQNLLGEWEYSYTTSSTETICRMSPLSASERIDNSGLFDNVKYKCFCLSSSSINRDGQIEFDGSYYRIKDVMIDSSNHHKTALLQLIT